VVKPHGRGRHILTVVLEDYFQVAALSRIVPRRYWPRFESHVERHTEAALDLLDATGAKATFFVLGWTADRCPGVIAEVVRRGHEVASKGYFHRSLREMSPGEFRDDALRARDALEQAAGTGVRGYRIARGGVTSRKDLWMLDVLAEHGFAYDSSLRPLGRAFAGEPFRRFVHRHSSGARTIWEVPLSSMQIGGWALPIAGGNYLRQLPQPLVRRALSAWEDNVESPIVFYFHVWELDPRQPRISGAPMLQHLRQYRNLARMMERVEYYLSRYRFTSIADYLRLPPAPVTSRVAPTSAQRSAARVKAEPRRVPTPVTCVVPCYNEQTTLPYLARTLDLLKAETVDDDFRLAFIFIDDGSTDGTWAQLGELFGDRADCTLVRHDRNRGVAAATLTGVAHARTETVGVIDCDCSYDPEQLRAMLPLLRDDVALVTASPYHPKGQVQNVPAWRLVLSRGLSMLYRRVLHHQLATYTSCFRVYRRSAVAGLTITHEGFLGIVEILARLDLAGARIVECPAVLEARLLGHSKMKVLKTIGGHLGLLARLIVRRWGLGNCTAWEDQPFLRTLRSRN
jgi:polysaccharide deacetylase family protein (PEP-CTERM system associated)